MRLAELVPASATMVAESGIRTRADVARLQSAGYKAFLIGETLMRAADPAAALAELRGIEPVARRAPLEQNP
jgi:indole-3-glycerol phosphate synthase